MEAEIIVSNIGYSTKEKRVLESINNLLNTKAGTLAGNREFGLDYSCLDKPIKVAEALLIQDIYVKVQQFEPRANIQSVNCTIDGKDGKITTRMVIEVV